MKRHRDAQAHALLGHVVAAVGGHQDDGNVLVTGQRVYLLGQRRNAIDMRHHQVGDDEADLFGAQQFERADGVAGGDHPVAIAPKERRDEVQRRRVVVDDEDGDTGYWRAPRLMCDGCLARGVDKRTFDPEEAIMATLEQTLHLAEEAWEAFEFEDALNLAQQALKLDASSLEALDLKANALAELGDWEQADEAFGALLAHDPGNAARCWRPPT